MREERTGASIFFTDVPLGPSSEALAHRLAHPLHEAAGRFVSLSRSHEVPTATYQIRGIRRPVRSGISHSAIACGRLTSK
jgi:hypothetical protein